MNFGLIASMSLTGFIYGISLQFLKAIFIILPLTMNSKELIFSTSSKNVKLKVKYSI